MSDDRTKLAVIDQKVIDEIVARLLQAAPRGSKVILFGSQARGDADALSDIDVMVVEPEVTNRIKEMIRLDSALDPLLIPVDVLVASAAEFEYWKNTPNTVHYHAAREGKVHE